VYTLEELKKQNREIDALLELLSAIKDHKNLCTNPFVCDLVSRFNEKVWMHLVFEESTIYSELQKHHNPDIEKILTQFNQSAREIRKLFTHYVKNWCKTGNQPHDHDAFVEESEQVYHLMAARIKFENEEVFPLVEAHFEQNEQA